MVDAAEISGEQGVWEQEASAKRLADRLQEQIHSGELAVGTWLRQGRIAEEFGISRTPVREAISALHARGLVEVIQNRGARVRRLSVREIREAYVVRAELEGVAAALAAELASDEQVERLKMAEELFAQALAELSSGEDVVHGRETWRRANDIFHEAVLEASGNATLRAVVDSVYERIPRNLTWAGLDGEPRRLRANIAEHRAVREAIEAGDAAAARRAMVDHVLRSADLVARRSE